MPTMKSSSVKAMNSVKAGTARTADLQKAAAQAAPAAGSPQLLERTFAVLALFTADHPEWTTTEISVVSGLPVPTSHRIVVALNRHNFLARDPITKRFRLGPAAISLGRAALSSVDLPTAAGRLLPGLTARTEETSLLTVLSDSNQASVCLLRVESPHPLRLSVQPGRHLPLHAGASQKALLAFMPEENRERLINGPLEKFCALTLDTPEPLRAEIERIRTRGWALSFEETNLGVWGIAITLLDSSGHSVAAIGVAAPQVRASVATVENSLLATQDVVQTLASELGLTSSAESATFSPRELPAALRSS